MWINTKVSRQINVYWRPSKWSFFFPCKEKEINYYWDHLCVRHYDRHFHLLLCYFLLCYFTSFVSSEDSITWWSWAWTLVSDHLSSNPQSIVSWYQFPHQETNSLLCPWNSPVKNTGLGCHFLLRGIFPTQWLNLGFVHCRQILYHLRHQGSRNL